MVVVVVVLLPSFVLPHTLPLPARQRSTPIDICVIEGKRPAPCSLLRSSCMRSFSARRPRPMSGDASLRAAALACPRGVAGGSHTTLSVLCRLADCLSQVRCAPNTGWRPRNHGLAHIHLLIILLPPVMAKQYRLALYKHSSVTRFFYITPTRRKPLPP
jgi:hypothetical protein